MCTIGLVSIGMTGMNELSRSLVLIAIVACAASVRAATTSAGLDYPSKVIRIIASATGGGSDFNSRLISPALSAALGQPIVIDNRPGTFMLGKLTAAATPDGHTLLMAASDLWLQPFLHELAPFDPVKDFSPVTLLTTSPLVVVVHASVAVNTVKELITLAKAKPAALNYGSGNTGSSSHLGAELFRSMAGINVVRVPYKGVGPALNALLAGDVQLMVASAGSVMAYGKSGKLKVLASTGARQSSLLPGLPTVAESGVPGYEFAQTLGVLAPAKTLTPVINRLYIEITRILAQPDVKQKFVSVGVETVGNSPAEFAALIKTDMMRLGKVIREAGIRAE